VGQAIRATELLACEDCPETSEGIRLRLSSAPARGIDPEDLFALDVPYDVELTWSKLALDRFDAIFRLRSAAAPMVAGWSDPAIPRRAWDEYTNRRGSRAISPSLSLELKERASQHLPAYMVPGRIVLMEALPRTPNGKIDRKALPEPDRDRPVTASENTPPQTEIEKTIAAVLQQLLNVARVGTSDNFFDLGANSLIMVQIHSHLRAALRRDLSLVDLFRYSTVSALAAHLGKSGEGPSELRPSQERGLARVDALQRRRAALRSDLDRGQVSSKS
jgi:acyl carrier protein